MCDEIKDSGNRPTVSSKIGFSSHINNTVAREHARSNLIYEYECLTSRDVTTLAHAYTALANATCIWSSQHITVMRQVESVQRHFTKRLPGLNNAYELRRFLGYSWYRIILTEAFETGLNNDLQNLIRFG
jgi:hypothetical protein